jgi:hypothetical protein
MKKTLLGLILFATPAWIATPQQLDFAVDSIEARITESNDQWSRYAWRLGIRNDANEPHVFQGRVEFQDRDGFIVDTGDAYGMLVPAKSTQVFTGFKLVNAAVVGKVAKVAADVHRTR